MRMVAGLAMTMTVLALAACGQPEDADGLTAAENRELDEDAARLEAAHEEAQMGMQEAAAAETAAAQDQGEAEEH